MSEHDLISGRRGQPRRIDSNPQAVVSQQDQPINRPLIAEGRKDRNGQSQIELQNVRAHRDRLGDDDDFSQKSYLSENRRDRITNVLCWVRFVCGSLDNTEIAIPVSIGIIPVTFVNLFVYFLTYNSIYFGRRMIVNCMKWFIFIYSIILILVGISIIVFSIIIKADDKQGSWDRLSDISKSDFYSNDINEMFKIYQTNMILAGVFALLIGVLIFLQFLLMCYYSGVLMNDWLPPYQSRFIDPWPIKKKVQRYKLEEKYGNRQKQVLIKIYKKRNFKEVRDLLGIIDPVDQENERLQEEHMKAVNEKAGQERKKKSSRQGSTRDNKRGIDSRRERQLQQNDQNY